MANNRICYNCGKPLTPEIATVEHVPAKNLYDGFSDEFKRNRITVPACYDCNQKFSKIDQEIRDALAVKSDDPNQKQLLTGKGVRSILRRQNWKNRTYRNEQGQVIAVDFSYDDLREIHIKNFKALFYRKYGHPVPEEFEIDIIADGDNERKVEIGKVLFDYVQLDKSFEFSGHPDIFKFILKDLTPDIPNDTFHESGDLNQAVGVAALLVYHNDIGAILLAGKKEFIESSKHSRNK